MDNKKINRIIIDCDGTLTDGKINISHNGEVFKSFHSRDIRSIRELVARGYEVIICTASSSPIIESYAKKVGAQIEVSREKLYEGDYIAIGDDVWDANLLRNAKVAYCPLNADYLISTIRNINILPVNGGEGVISYMVADIFKNG